MQNWNNYASVKVPPERIREPEQIRCDTGLLGHYFDGKIRETENQFGLA